MYIERKDQGVNCRGTITILVEIGGIILVDLPRNLAPHSRLSPLFKQLLAHLSLSLSLSQTNISTRETIFQTTILRLHRSYKHLLLHHNLPRHPFLSISSSSNNGKETIGSTIQFSNISKQYCQYSCF